MKEGCFQSIKLWGEPGFTNDGQTFYSLSIRHCETKLAVGQRSGLFTEIKSQDFLAVKPLNSNLLLLHWLSKCFNGNCKVLLSQGIHTFVFRCSSTKERFGTLYFLAGIVQSYLFITQPRDHNRLGQP